MTMASEFSIGLTTSIYDFILLEDLLDQAGDPDWSFQQYATAIRLGDGTLKGQGFPVAIWRWNFMTNANRDELKDLCPNLSALIYIRTPTNEIDVYGDLVWGTFQCIMNWTPEDEDKQVNKTLGLIVTFTHLVEVVE